MGRGGARPRVSGEPLTRRYGLPLPTQDNLELVTGNAGGLRLSWTERSRLLRENQGSAQGHFS